MQRILSAVALIFMLSIPAIAQDKVADWVGVGPEDGKAPGVVVYHKTFDLDFDPERAYLKFTCFTAMDFGGTNYRVWVNRIAGPGGSFWMDAQYADISKALRKGKNEIAIEVKWEPNGPSGPVLAKLVAMGKDEDGNEKTAIIRSDDTWRYYPSAFDLKGEYKNRQPRSVVVAGPADTWQPAKSPQVLPKINTGKVIGVTDVVMKGGNAGSLYQFNLVRDYSDKFYFLQAMGYGSVEDYIFGQSNYQYPGTWFWGYDKQIAQNQGRAGFEYTVYPWVWVPAEWYRKDHNPPMVKCMEHDKEGFGISMWSKDLLKFNDDMYSELQKNFGDKIKFIYPAIYGDFGEAHYMAGWNNWLHPKADHQHAGFWVGDDSARADFKRRVVLKHGSIEAVNTAWGTSFKTEDEITYPKLDGSDNRRWALDFVDWYYDAMTDFTTEVCTIAKKHFPDVPMAPKLGCGDENPMWGQDNSAIPEALAKIGVGIRSTHGSSPNFCVRRLSSASKFYGNQFETETAGGTNRKEALKKFFIDASSGCEAVFEYPNAIITVADIFSDTRRNLRGEHSINEIALFFPTSWHRSNLRQGYPPKLVQAAEELRDTTDFDIVDENMVQDGALKSYRVLVMFDGNFMEQSTYDKISDWVNKGGALVGLAEQLPLTNVESDQFPICDLAEEAKAEGGAACDLGQGQIMVWNGDWNDRRDYYELIYSTAYPSAYDGLPGSTDGKQDGVWTSLFRDRVLYLNTSDAPITVLENISEELAKRVGLDYRPEFLAYSIEVPAKSQAVHLLNGPFAEFTLECEEMDGANKHPIEVIYKGGYGTPGKAVKIPANNYVRKLFRIDKEADYGFYCVADPSGKGEAKLEVDGKPVADITGPAGPHKFMYPLTAKVHLKPGEHLVALKFGEGTHSADKVVITTDTGLAGFAYGYVNPEVDQTW